MRIRESHSRGIIGIGIQQWFIVMIELVSLSLNSVSSSALYGMRVCKIK